MRITIDTEGDWDVISFDLTRLRNGMFDKGLTVTHGVFDLSKGNYFELGENQKVTQTEAEDKEGNK